MYLVSTQSYSYKQYETCELYNLRNRENSSKATTELFLNTGIPKSMEIANKKFKLGQENNNNNNL